MLRILPRLPIKAVHDTTQPDQCLSTRSRTHITGAGYSAFLTWPALVLPAPPVAADLHLLPML